MPRQYRLLITVIAVVLIVVIRFFLTEQDARPRGPYFGQTPPDNQPRVFAPNFISDQFNNRDAALSPDGTEFYFSLWTGSYGLILFSKEVKGRWTTPERVPFSSGHSDIEPFITPDGSRLYFASNRPVNGDDSNDYDIWYVDRRDNQWGEPTRLDSIINSPADEFYPTASRNGTLYFTTHRDDGFGGEDIYRSEYRHGAFQTPENLGDAINSPRGEFNALVAPDESFLIFSSFGRTDGSGGGDLYISFNEQNTWRPAINMGEFVNSPRLDYCPAITPDGQFLLFSSRKSTLPTASDIRDLNDLKDQLSSCGNGNDDIYWMRSTIIETLR